MTRACLFLCRLLGFFALFAAFSAPARAVDWFYFTNSTSTGFMIKAKTGKEVCDVSVPFIRPGWGARATGYYTNQSGECPAYNLSNASQTAYVASYIYKFCPADKPELDWDRGPVCVVSVKPTCPKDSPGEGVWHAGSPGMPSPMQTGGCVNGCSVNMTDLKSCWGPTGTYADYEAGKAVCKFGYLTIGTQCTAGPGSPGTVPDPGSGPRMDQVPPQKPPPGTSSCPKGTVQGGFDSAGIPICIGTGSDPKNAPPLPPKIESSKTEQQADGSTKTTKTETITNSDGSTTTNTTVTITRPDGTKESSGGTVTSKTPTGTAGKADTPEKDQYDLCKQNPNLTICRNSSVSGACGEISCTGDAIQCATLRAAAAMQCTQQADKEALAASSSKALGDQILAGNDPMKGEIDAALKGSEVDLSKTALDQSGFVGGGSCFPDKTFMVVGKPVTVSFARVCQDIQPLRAAVMACAFIIAYLIVGRSVIQG